jgi:hypothetical protein
MKKHMNSLVRGRYQQSLVRRAPGRDLSLLSVIIFELEDNLRQQPAPANSAEATDDLQDRLGRFARFAFSLAGTIFIAARVIELSKFGGVSVTNLVAPNWIAYEFALLILFLAWRRCRRSRMSRAALEAFEAALTIVISSCWAMLGWGPDANYPVSTGDALDAHADLAVGRSAERLPAHAVDQYRLRGTHGLHHRDA